MSVELRDTLDRLRLQEYIPALLENGFDSWDVVCDITEDDLAQLGFKLGHRRILQREIASSRGLLHDQSLDPEPNDHSPDNVSSTQSPTTPRRGEERTKRRYRRKPRPDINAPKKPKTAYVNFADILRTDPAVSSLSFVEIAREVGRRWQALPPDQKHAWECQAARSMQEYEAQMDEYKTTENYRRYQNYLKTFRQEQAQGKRSRSRPVPALELDRKSRSNSSETLSNDSNERNSRSHSGCRESDEYFAAVALAMQELSVRRDQVLAADVPTFDTRNLPPEDLTRKAAYACTLGTGSLMFLVGDAQLEALLDRVYGQSKIDPVDLVLVMGAAAVGAHYDIDCMTESMRSGLFASSALLLDTEISRSDYRAMQIFLLLSVYCLLEKHMIIRYVIAAGLQISRSKYPFLETEIPNEEDRNDFKRVLCTLIFMEWWVTPTEPKVVTDQNSWLSTTLGYKSDVRPEDVTRGWSPIMQSASITDAIYFQASKIGLVSRDIADITVHKAANAVRIEHVELLTEKLDAWYKALPANMHLAALTNDKQASVMTFYQRRAIMMVHMFYLGAIIALYRQLLLNAFQARIGSEWNLDMPYSQIQNYRNRCSIAAQQMARIMTLISFSGAMTKRCWLMIYWAFHSSLVVLFSVALQMMDRESATVEQDLSYAKVGVDILCACSTSEPVAAKHLGLIKPLFDALVEKHKRLQAMDPSANPGAPTSLSRPATIVSASPHASLADACAHDQPPDGGLDGEIVSIVKKLSDLLADPFGLGLQAKIQGVRETSNAVGTYSVLWWK